MPDSPGMSLFAKRPIERGVVDATMKHAFPVYETPYAKDPHAWCQNVLKRHMWSKQVDIMESVRDNRHTGVQSCHSAGKSATAATIGGWWVDSHAAGQAFVITTAPTGAQVYAVLWRELQRVHKLGSLQGKITQQAMWKIDDELVAIGRKPNDYEPDAFQGIHARYLLAIIDEANGVPQALWDAIESLASNQYARILAIGNPDDPASYFAKMCAPGSGWNTIRISAFDTPNFTDEVVPDDLRPLLVSPEWVEERKKRWGENSPIYISKVLGEFPDISDDTLIQPRWILAAQHRFADRKIVITPHEHGTLGCDIARYGNDESVIYRLRDDTVELEWSGYHESTMKTTGRIIREIKRLSMGSVIAHVDGVGLGAGVVDRLAELGYDVVDFQGGQKSFEPDRFVNQRSEQYWALRQRFEDGRIAIDPDDDVLAAQLGAIKWTTNSKGKVEVERKEDYRKRTKAASPDRADAVMMACAEGASTVPLSASDHDDYDEEDDRPMPYTGRNSDTGLQRVDHDGLLGAEPGHFGAVNPLAR